MRHLAVTVPLFAWSILQPSAAVAAPAQEQQTFASRVLELTNEERLSAGLAPLAPSDTLHQSAQGYTVVLATTECFQHTCGPVPDFIDRDDQAGYTGWTLIGENLAAGFQTPEDVVAGWMASPGHRANILSPEFTEVGVGVTAGNGPFGTYWAEEFGTRDDAMSDAAQ